MRPPRVPLGLTSLLSALLGCAAPPPASPPDLGAPIPGPRPLRHASINHVLLAGQSLSFGALGAPPLSTTQPYQNLMFNAGVINTGAAHLAGLVPLVESDVETLSSGMANLIAQLAHDEAPAGQPPDERSHDVLVSGHGVGGTPYAGLKKGSQAYATGMAQVRAGLALAHKASRSYAVRAIVNVHGESDHVAGNPHYADDLLLWQADYEADVQALTGQTEPVPMLHSQMSSWTAWGAPHSRVPQDQLFASLRRPDRLILVGPKYMLPYADGVHLTNTGYRWLGEYYAKVYHQVVLEGRRWSPLRPLSAQRDGLIVTLRFEVPRPPLVLDTTRVSDPGQRGFEVVEASAAPVPIRQVELADPDRVVLTLSRLPAGPGARVRYAYTGEPGQPGGPTTGPRGNLRDSDPTPSRSGAPLYNWCVHFDLPLP